MTVENVKKFAEKIIADQQLRNKIRPALTEEEVVEIGTRHGFQFTVHDLRLYDARLYAAAGVISEEDLERATRGVRLGHSLGVSLTEVDTCGTPCCKVGARPGE
jgi:predicted ribosomally synthesized peptide with nif11-like leader